MKLVLPLIIVASMTVGSGEYHAVDWYVGHPSERVETLKWCRDNMGIARSTPNCENALQAADTVSSHLFSLFHQRQTAATSNLEYQRWCSSLGAASPCGN